MRKSTFLFLPVLLLLAVSCSKKTGVTPPATVPERIEIVPANKSVKQKDTAIFKVIYYNNLGVQATTPAGIIWSSGNNSIATINSNGVASGVNIGQTAIKAQYNAASSTALLTVVQNDLQVATITIDTQVEMELNGTQTLTAVAKNINGVVLPGKTFTWQSSNTNLVTVDMDGKLTGKSHGTALITASTDGLQSNSCMAQVIRKGAFTGMGSAGTGKLKISNGILVLETTSDFSVNTGAPDLRIYLSNNSGNVNDALEIATLAQRSGAQSWNVPAGVTIGQYKYLLVWCKQFGGAYGVALLSN